MSDRDKFYHIESISINLESQLKALAALCHKVLPVEAMSGDELCGFGLLLENLAAEARACLTIATAPAKPAEDTDGQQ